jgi:hypothetical protein
MRNQLTLALLGVLLVALVGCQAETTSVISGPFHVNSNTGRATGQALGIHFEVFGATRAKTKDVLKAGRPEHTSAQIEITLADDAVIRS